MSAPLITSDPEPDPAADPDCPTCKGTGIYMEEDHGNIVYSVPCWCLARDDE